MKKSILYLLLILAQGLNAQEILKTTFHKKDNNEEVSSSKKSDYTRVVKSSSQNGVFAFTETWKDGALKREGFLTEYVPKFKQTGKETTYHKNGKISTIQHVKFHSKNLDMGGNQTSISENMNLGDYESFYENGNPKEKGVFTEPARRGSVRFNYPQYIVKQISDSLGNSLLDAQGSGKINITYANGDILEGEYVNGLKNGARKEYHANEKETYIENFENGKFISGLFIDQTGKEANYKQQEIFPQFAGGIPKFYLFLSENLKYPTEMRKQRIEGRINVKFMVEKDGKVKNYEINNADPEKEQLETEALRVLGLSPKWVPGLLRGKTVRVSYLVPIVFKLNS